MSSFKRRNNAPTQRLLPGTKMSPANSSTHITSSGVPSLDDVLGGGIQLGTDLLLLNPDPHSAHTDLLQKYFISQGLASGHKVHVFDNEAKSLVETCMWMPGESAMRTTEEDERPKDEEDKVKIAWRYENMQKFKTTVASKDSDQEDYCRPFDLSSRIPPDIVRNCLGSGQLNFEETYDETVDDIYRIIIERIEYILSSAYPSSPSQDQAVTRICIPNFSGPHWGDPTPEKIIWFLFRLRGILRKYVSACACVSLPSYLSTDIGNSEGWVEKLAWSTDACIALNSSSADPSASALHPSHHGLLKIHRLPCVQTLVPASDRFSTLRGLSTPSASISSGGVGENNLAFKCTRKRFVIETFHLDIEGGVGERRTAPASSIVFESDHVDKKSIPHQHTNGPQNGTSAVTIEVETVGTVKASKETHETKVEIPTTVPAENKIGIKKKQKKRVGFQVERPELEF